MASEAALRREGAEEDEEAITECIDRTIRMVVEEHERLMGRTFEREMDIEEEEDEEEAIDCHSLGVLTPPTTDPDSPTSLSSPAEADDHSNHVEEGVVEEEGEVLDELLHEDESCHTLVIKFSVNSGLPIEADDEDDVRLNNDDSRKEMCVNLPNGLQQLDEALEARRHQQDQVHVKMETEDSVEEKPATIEVVLQMDVTKEDVAKEESSCQSAPVCDPVSLVCKWKNCDWPGSYDDLVDHIREIHVELQPYINHQPSSTFTNSSSSSTPTPASTPGPASASGSAWAGIISSESTSSTASVSSVSEDKSEPVPSSSTPYASICILSESGSQQTYVCLWESCKVYGKRSLSRSWLERHVLQHSGPRPFKCIVEGCGCRFKARSALERHVNAHFNGSLPGGLKLVSVPSLNGDNSEHGSDDLQPVVMMRAKGSLSGSGLWSANGSISGTPNKLSLKRKKQREKSRANAAGAGGRRCFLRGNQDYFDACIMEHLQYSLFKLNKATGLDTVGSQRNITFQSKVIARRREEKSGTTKLLLHYEPEDLLPDEWVSERDMARMWDSETEKICRTMPVASLPCESIAKFIENTSASFSGSSSSSSSSTSSSSTCLSDSSTCSRGERRRKQKRK